LLEPCNKDERFGIVEPDYAQNQLYSTLAPADSVWSTSYKSKLMVLKGLGGNQPTLFVYLYPPRILIPTWMDIDLPTRGGLLLSSFSSRSGQEPVRLSGRASRSASVMLLNRILFTFFINSATDLVVAGSRSSLIDLTSSSSESAGMKGGSGNFLLVGYEKI